MAGNFLPLEEAAKVLGVPTDQLVAMRSAGEVRGFRDGTSWKFPAAEIERLKDELAGGGEEDDYSPGIFAEAPDESPSDSGAGSKVIGGDEAGSGIGSDVELVPASSEGSDVELVAGGDEDEDDLRLAPLEQSGNEPAAGSKKGEAADADSGAAAAGGDDLRVVDDESVDDFTLEADDDNVLDDIELDRGPGGTGDLIHGDSDPAVLGGSAAASGADVTPAPAPDDDDDLVISDDDDSDDLVLGGGSDISIAGDSGINLMSPSDSGLSLEGEPLDLAGSSISALDLGDEVGEKPGSGSAGGSGSLVDFQADEEFQLSPSGIGLDADDDSGSQVIEVEDSADAFADDALGDDAFGDVAVIDEDEGLGGFGDEAVALDEEAVAVEEEGFTEPATMGAHGAVPTGYEVPYSVWQVVVLVSIILVMSIAGMMMTDLVRNMSDFAGETGSVSSLTDAVLGMLGLDN